MSRRLVLLTAAMGCFACTDNKPVKDSVSVQPAGPIIVHIVSRDMTITARAGIAGPTYSLHTVGGEAIAPAMTLEALQAQHPGLARYLQALQAGAWAGLD